MTRQTFIDFHATTITHIRVRPSLQKLHGFPFPMLMRPATSQPDDQTDCADQTDRGGRDDASQHEYDIQKVHMTASNNDDPAGPRLPAKSTSLAGEPFTKK
jgi:hypothetical protein